MMQPPYPGTPESNEPTDPTEPTVPYGQPNYPPPPPPPPYGQQPGTQPPAQQWGPPPPGYGFNPGAPYGVDPATGVPYSDKQKLVAGLLQILIPLGIGRMYMGQTGIGIAQLLVTLVTCGIGALWPFIDGIVILAGQPKDAQGRPLRP